MSQVTSPLLKPQARAVQQGNNSKRILLGFVVLVIFCVLIALYYKQQYNTTEDPTSALAGPDLEGTDLSFLDDRLTERPTTERPTTEGPTTEGPTTEGPTTEPTTAPTLPPATTGPTARPITEEELDPENFEGGEHEDDGKDPCERLDCDSKEEDSKDKGTGNAPYLNSRFVASTPVSVREGEDKVMQLDFVLPDSQFPIGNLIYSLKRYKKPTMIPFKRCEVKWNNTELTSTANYNWDNRKGKNRMPFLGSFEKWSGGRFKWSMAEFHIVDMKSNLIKDLKKVDRKAYDAAVQKIQTECPKPGDGLTNIVYHMSYPTTGGAGYAHTGTFLEHEGGHGLGFWHANGLKSYNKPSLNSTITKYNTHNLYGSWNCIMGNMFKGTSPGYCAPTMWLTGWLPDNHFVFIKDGETYRIRNQMNWSSNLPLALCFRDPYTGSPMMLEYAGKDNKSMFAKNDKFVWKDPADNKSYQRGFILSTVPAAVVQLIPYSSESIQTPYGWHFQVTKHNENEATLKVTYKPDTVTYKPARIKVKPQRTDVNKMRLFVKLCDFNGDDDVNNPPRAYVWSKIVLRDPKGKEYKAKKQGSYHVMPTFIGSEKSKTEEYDGYGIEAKQTPNNFSGFPTKVGFADVFFDIENPSKTAGDAEFKLMINRDHHCMVKILNLRFS